MPDIDVRVLDPTQWQNEDNWRWRGLWEFALTFDGYRFFGGDLGAPERLAVFDDSIREAFLVEGQLPAIDLALLRACLFYEQRRWCQGSMEGPGDSERSYLQALLDGIRRAIH